MKVGFVSLGCPKNLVDSEVMMGRLSERGHELTPKPDEADVIVVNTCSFIDPAKQESIDTILEMRSSKSSVALSAWSWPAAWWSVTAARFRISSPEVDALIGTNELDGIVAACEGIDSPASR